MPPARDTGEDLTGSLPSPSLANSGIAGTYTKVRSDITDNSISKADISSSAAIAITKLSRPILGASGHALGSSMSISGHGLLRSLANLSTIGASEISNGNILNEDISRGVAITDSKLATNSTPGKFSGSAITSGSIK